LPPLPRPTGPAGVVALRHGQDLTVRYDEVPVCAETIASVANYEKRLAQARADLALITAAITIFEPSGDVEEMPPYVDIHRCFKRGEAFNLCKEALASGPLNTRQLALRVMPQRTSIPATKCSPRR